ncbi:unnamed protein product [Penicillium pancosmium]
MVKRNVAIAIIIIVLFLLLALAGFAIWAVQNHVSFFSKKREPDEESAEGISISSRKFWTTPSPRTPHTPP